MSDFPGIGSMLHQLSGGSPKSASDYYGRKIVKVELNEERLLLSFDDGVTVKLWDDGQSCCEHRYISCDDDISTLIGNTLVDVSVRDGGEVVGEYGESHEKKFIVIQTSKSSITLCTHNEHNGYYGGFGLSIDEVKS